MVEQNRIIDPRIGIFQDAISSATHDLREAISKKYMPAMLPILPHDNPNGGVFPRAMPSDVMIENLEAATNEVVDALNDLIAYGHDLQVELQNHLLGDLRSEEHTSELQSLMRISYAVFCLKKKNNTPIINNI